LVARLSLGATLNGLFQTRVGPTFELRNRYFFALKEIDERSTLVISLGSTMNVNVDTCGAEEVLEAKGEGMSAFATSSCTADAIISKVHSDSCDDDGSDEEESEEEQENKPNLQAPAAFFFQQQPHIPFRFFPHQLEGSRGGVQEAFPRKLHRMLLTAETEGRHDVISFLSHGRAFTIHKPRRFAEEIMPRFFKQSKISSFHRQLNLYGFKRVTQGPDVGAYYHEMFLKGRPELCLNMKRTKIKGAQKKNEAKEEAPSAG
jgi:hypothetical protein